MEPHAMTPISPWAFLSAIEGSGEGGSTDVACRDIVASAYPDIPLGRIRMELQRLAIQGVVSMEDPDSSPCRVVLTPAGRDKLARRESPDSGATKRH